MSDEMRCIERIRTRGLTAQTIRSFQKLMYQHYLEHQRPMPWRKTRNTYHILLSEVMLQQTQVERVLVKYREFIRAFPNFSRLAKAPLAEVLRVWQGMGYNRRAINLKKLAELIVHEYQGKLPLVPEELIKLPGIGKYSASAIYTFATNKPACFIETNIRRVYIHFFFGDREGIRDEEIMPLVEKTMDRAKPREWYYALMDYGVQLKKEVENPNRRSAHYAKQSKFEGSDRQVRGMILKTLLHSSGITKSSLGKKMARVPENFDQIVDGLIAEGFLKKTGSKLSIP
ncbi:MAG: A/G-specific adenine glycosylase [Nitrospirae bacterium]|nr:A/G-specific adenine glycosylase [Nitrospirota bacterium]